MRKVPFARPIRKVPRPKAHKLYPILSMMRQDEDFEYCADCMAKFEAQAQEERPGHVWAIDKGKVIFLEDVVIEHKLGRRLLETESIIHKDGNFLNNYSDNLEVVRIDTL